jgi:hypothetical protein
MVVLGRRVRRRAASKQRVARAPTCSRGRFAFTGKMSGRSWVCAPYPNSHSNKRHFSINHYKKTLPENLIYVSLFCDYTYIRSRERGRV